MNCNGIRRKSAYLSHDTCINVVKHKLHCLVLIHLLRFPIRGGGGGLTMPVKKDVYLRLNSYIVLCDLITPLDSLKTVKVCVLT